MRRRRDPRLRICVAALSVSLLAAFVAGGYAGRWAVRNQAYARFRVAVASALEPKTQDGKAQSRLDKHAEWSPLNTNLVRIETSELHLPMSDGWGGGIQAMSDGRILYATRTGEFGVVDVNGLPKSLQFKVDLNLDSLVRHPVYKLKTFRPNWFRVTDINLNRIGDGRYELLVGHHYFDSLKQCVELRLTGGELVETSESMSLAGPFHTILVTKPCITFNHPDYPYAFEGHFSGGRIARLSANQVLFSTGDHGWAGLRGYPAVSQDDNSTLGKILLVNTSTGEVKAFAKGLRNPQGLTIDSKGRIWSTEHGPRGGDELNLITAGSNYGWPYSTYGTDYDVLPWPLNDQQGRHTVGEPPRFSWVPSIGVSNLIEVTGDEFPLWRGDLLVLSLAGQAMRRLRLDGTRVVYDEPIAFEGFRLRSIVQLPNGRLAILTDFGTIILVRNADLQGKTPYLDATHQQRRTADMSEQERAAAVAGRYANQSVAPADTSERLPPDVERGERVFQGHCSGCHSIDRAITVIGPTLKGVVGRRVGSAAFAYTRALAGRNEVWTSQRIVDFVTKPTEMYAGCAMAPVRLAQADLRDLARYLEATGR